MFRKKNILSIILILIILISGIGLFFFTKKKESAGGKKEKDLVEKLAKYENNIFFKQKDFLERAQKCLTAYVFYVNDFSYSVSDELDTSITSEIEKEYQDYQKKINNSNNKELFIFLRNFHLKSITFFGIVFPPKKEYFDELKKDYISDLQKELINKKMVRTHGNNECLNNDWCDIITTDEPLEEMKKEIEKIKEKIYFDYLALIKGLKINFSVFLEKAKKEKWQIK